MRELFSHMLAYLGYASVCTCEDTEALRLYKQARDGGHPFTGVILDLHNYLGKGGAETIAALRALDPGIKAVLCSGNTDAPATKQFQARGFRGRRAKPFRFDDLRHILHDAL